LNQVIFVDSSNICLIQVINYLKLIQEKFYYLILAKFFFCVVIWGHSVSFGLWMRFLGFLGTCGYFLMLTKWNCSFRCVVSKIAWKFRTIWIDWLSGADANELELNVSKCKSMDCVILLNFRTCWVVKWLWSGCRVSLGTIILLRPFTFSLWARNLIMPVVCVSLSMAHTSIELSVCRGSL
jgi:hypothetical protein